LALIAFGLSLFAGIAGFEITALICFDCAIGLIGYAIWVKVRDSGLFLAFLKLVLRWLVAGTVLYGIYTFADYKGYIQHTCETTISVQSDWLVGESKECWSATLNSDRSALLGKEVGYAMSSVFCDDGPEHKMKIAFYGRKVQTEYKVVSWRCTRNEVSFLNGNSFTCYQTGGKQVVGNTGAVDK
jgi:hypothetical protein